MTQPAIQQIFDQAVRLRQSGRLKEAEQLYRQVLAQQPRHVEATYHLGLIAHQAARDDLATDWIRRAIALRPDFAEAHSTLGVALISLGQVDQALAAFRQAVALRPNFPDALNNLGNILIYNGQYAEAIAALQKAIALKPNYPQAHSNLGNALKEMGQLDEAIAAYRNAISLDPNFPDAQNNLGNALNDKGQYDEAIAALRKAIALRPNYAEAHSNLGNALKEKEQFDQAIAAYRKAISCKPNYAEVFSNLGGVLKENGQLDDAIAACRQSIALKPSFRQAHGNLGNLLKETGQLDESIAAYEHALALGPNSATMHSNLIFTIHYHPDYDAAKIAEELGRWNHRHAEPLRKFIRGHSNDTSPDRRLRIGYVSPDLRDHPVGRNILPLFQQHDRAHFEIIAYAHVLRPDALTRQFQQSADAWRNTVGVSDDQVAKQIRQDRIDILIDLALHTADNRLLVFARKPVPVQVSYLGYPGSTGLNTIDYRLSDPYLDPPSADLSSYTEKTLRLPHTYWCYQPPATSTPEPAPSPALKNGFVTFGCQNNYCKISSATWKTWIDILRAQPNSKLLVYTGQGSHRNIARKILADAAIDPDRLLFSDSRGAQYFQRYNDIDIALDPFPFGGGTTTCDALWMGVPVITLSGQTAVGRGGRSILSNLGLPELIAYTPDQYVQIALNLASDPDRMDSLRRAMRPRLQASPLMNAEQFARDIESVYRQMWQEKIQTR